MNNKIIIDRYILTLKHELITGDGTHIELDKPTTVAYDSLCFEPYKNFSPCAINYVLARLTDELRKYYLNENGYE